MKKIYIAPSQYVVRLHTAHIIAESLMMYSDSGDDGVPTITSCDDILTKEVTTKNLWDETW